MIGVFDSGIGGLTLLHELTKTLPHEDFAYYADIVNVPYSYKTADQILIYVENAVLFLREKGAKAIVLACNTATNVAIEYLREKYDFPIIAIQPAVKVAADFSEDHKRILACATPVTLNAERYKKLIEKLGIENRITNVALPKLVEFAEKGIFTGTEVESYLSEKLTDYNNSDYHFVVLGCTHFTFYEKLIERQFPYLKTVDGNIGTAKQVKKVLKEGNLLKEKGSGYLHFYESGRKVVEVSKYIKLLVKLRA
jgi:glutamate racemase